MLYIIPTPIGNREDITLRALRLFKEINIFICEDTRTFKSLLNMYEIGFKDKKMFSLTSFTDNSKMNFYKDLIKDNDVGLVSEAGTPGLSDPGKQLIKICWENNLIFEVLPGTNALVPCIVSAPFDTSEFEFWGFLPQKKGKQTKLQLITQSTKPIFVYESVHRVQKTLQELQKIGYKGKIVIFREITKKFQQYEYGDVDNMLSKMSNGEIVLKGEFVLGFYNRI